MLIKGARLTALTAEILSLIIKQMLPVIEQMPTSATIAVSSHSCVNVLWLCQDETIRKRKAALLTNSILNLFLRLAKNNGSDNSDAKHSKNNISEKGYQIPSFRCLVYFKYFFISLAINVTWNHHYCYNMKHSLCQMTSQFNGMSLRSLLSDKWFDPLAKELSSHEILHQNI